MRVALVTSLRGFGGGEEWFATATRLLEERGHVVRLVVRADSALAGVAAARGLPVREVAFGGVLDPRAIVGLRAVLEEIEADVAVANLEKEVRLLVLAGWGGRPLALVPRRGSDDPLKDRALERWIYGRRVTRVLVNSEAIAHTLRASLPTLPSDRIVVLPNGVDPVTVEAPAAAALHALWPEGPGARLVTVGELSARKNQAGIVRALAEVAGAWRLLVVGEGRDRAVIEGEVARLGLGERVRLAGHVPEARRVTAVADAFVHFSRSEGQPWAVLEALAQGVPTVATRLPGVEDMIEDGVTGRLVAPGDESGLAAVLTRWLARPGEARALGEAARARVAASHSDAALGDRLERVLEGARLSRLKTTRAVFLDRDGTLTPEAGAHGDVAHVRLLPGTGAALRLLDRAGYALVVVTNQAAVGRGLLPASDLRQVHARLRELVRNEGVELAGIFVCPHRPEDACACRKPRPGLIEDACATLGLSVAGSWLVGDTEKDVAAARAAGVRAARVGTGWAGAERRTAAGVARAARQGDPETGDGRELRVADLLAFAEFVTAGGGS